MGYFIVSPLASVWVRVAHTLGTCRACGERSKQGEDEQKTNKTNGFGR